jgi:AAA family ATP:ADP antiporter
MNTQKEFVGIRKILFPIHSYELRKVLPLFLLFMFISSTYYLLRSLKDMFLMSYTGKAETIYFLKVYGVTPFMILLTILYSKMSNLSKHTRFFSIMAYFFVIIGSCYLFFLPNINSLRLDSFADNLNKIVPGMSPFWEAIRFWPCSLIYLNAEAWGTMALGVLFWTFCNDVISFKDAKRIYGYIGSGAAVGTMFAGFLIKDFIKKDFLLGIAIALISILIISFIYFNIFLDTKRVPQFYQIESKGPKKSKVKMSFVDSLKFLMKSKHLMLIAALVLCYGIFISLFEAVAKSQVAKLTAVVGREALSQVYGYQGIANGILSIGFVFISGWLSKKSWKFTASITPTIAIICTGLFFIFLFSGSTVTAIFGGKGQIDITKILWITVIFGIANQVMIKAAKYIMFDSTCNQAYIPLDEESKIKGKAAVDGVGSRLGKSFGSLLLSAPYIGLVDIFGSIDNSKIFIAILIIIALFVWIKSVGSLSKILEKEEK